MAKNPFEDEYTAFVTNVKKLIDGEPPYRYPSVKDPTPPNDGRYGYGGVRYTEFSLEQHWRSGGIGGGSCWGEGDHYAIEGEAPPETFEDVNTVLEAYWPNITFLQYQKHIVPLFTSQSSSEGDYYGNSSNYTHKIISLRDLFVVFNENGILPA